MIETITERLNEQVEWLNLHGKNPVRIELGKLAYRRILLEVPFSSTTARIYDPVTNTLTTPAGTYPGTGSSAFGGGVLLPDGRVFCSMTPVFGFDPGNQPVEWQGLEVAVCDNLLDPWRAFVCCYDDPTESQ